MTEQLSLEIGLAIAESARIAARDQGAKVAIVLVGLDGKPVLMQRMDDAYFSAEVIASKKAFTAVNFGVATHVMAERLGTLEYQSLVTAADDRLTFLTGGLPLTTEGLLIGAIGVSGGTGDQDLACCVAAANRLETEVGR
ncbi:MAG TPA: heme-binding protein [Acidimicrobiia bacterium]|nr:heme-binding protein [Acidimicrobiia bacterium]